MNDEKYKDAEAFVNACDEALEKAAKARAAIMFGIAGLVK